MPEPKPKAKIMHLYRGAPSVRSWSKYQETVEDWTLCGINRRLAEGPNRHRAGCTDDASLVSCHYCLVLMKPARTSRQEGASHAG